MRQFLETLKQYVREHPPDYGDGESILDVLFWHYVEHNAIDSEKIREQFVALRKMLNLPTQDFDQVFYMVSDLCLEHGRLAFGEGVKIGIALLGELNS